MPRGINAYDEARLQGRLWTPAQVRPSLWLDGADLSTLSMSGSSVTELRDKSGNARHATTTVRHPGITRFNDLNVINFTASGATKLDTPDFNIAPDRQFCAFAVVSAASLLGGATYRRIWVTKGVNPDTLGAGATYAQGYFGSGGNSGEFLQIAGGTGISAPIVTGLGTSNIPVLLAGAFGTARLAANENSASANGGTRSTLTGQSGALSTTGIRIGSDVGTSGGSSWNSWIGEIILTLALSFPQVQAVEGYLAWKWGIRLAATHPFANRPPLIGD
ncbi:MAG: hypothetical protein ACK5QN_07655 [Burkholderiales bacterium]|jgi:hypothetical protein